MSAKIKVTTKKKKQHLGEVLPANSLILKQFVGTAKSDDGDEYTLTTSMSRNPLVQSMKTKKTFSLRWQDLIELAIEAGVDEPE